MATSGTTSYSVTELDIITDAMQNIGAVGAAETSIDPSDYGVARRKLNMLIKQWAAQIDFAPGLKMWTRRRGFLFLQAGQTVYSLGPSGDECASESYVSTTLAVAASGGASSITVASATGLAASMRIGILLDSGAFQWMIINGAPSGAVVSLGTNLSGAASVGARVFSYTSKVLRPFEIETASLRDLNGNDSPLRTSTLLEEHEAIGSKTAAGTPSELYFGAQRTNAKVYLDCQPDDLTEVIRFVYQSYIEDMSATTNDVAFPAEWFRAISAQLTLDLCVPFSRSATPEMREVAAQALAMAKNAYPERSVAEYQNNPDVY